MVAHQGGGWGTRTVANYNRHAQIGQGTYGRVSVGTSKDPKPVRVAIKKLLTDNHLELNPTVTREIKILQQLRHPNIVKLIEVVTSKCSVYEAEDREPINEAGLSRRQSQHKKDDKKDRHMSHDQATEQREQEHTLRRMGYIYLVLEYLDHDLAGLVDAKVELTGDRLQSIIKQILSALAYMHKEQIVHRDLKCSNILISNNNDVRLADFGLARSLDFSQYDDDEAPPLTTRVVTQWYRAPELFLGNSNYGPGIDMWSVGCIVVELVTGTPVFRANTELDTFRKQVDLLGWPKPSVWEKLVGRSKDFFIQYPGQESQSHFKDKYYDLLGHNLYDLCSRMLAWDPDQRITAQGALQSQYCRTRPERETHMLPLIARPGESFHEFETKAKIRTEREQQKDKDRQASRRGSFPPFPPGQPPAPSVASSQQPSQPSDEDMDIDSGDESYANKPAPPPPLPPHPHNLPLPPPPSLPPPPPPQPQQAPAPAPARRATTGGDDTHKVRTLSWDAIRGKTKPQPDKPSDKTSDKDGRQPLSIKTFMGADKIREMRNRRKSLGKKDGEDEDMSMDASGGGGRLREDEEEEDGWGEEDTVKDLKRKERQAAEEEERRKRDVGSDEWERKRREDQLRLEERKQRHAEMEQMAERVPRSAEKPRERRDGDRHRGQDGREQQRRHRDEDRGSRHEHRRSRSRDRRPHDDERRHKSRDHDRERDRDHDRERERERDRHGRHRSRDRRDRSRSRDRHHEDRHRRKSHSRDRKKSSRRRSPSSSASPDNHRRRRRTSSDKHKDSRRSSTSDKGSKRQRKDKDRDKDRDKESRKRSRSPDRAAAGHKKEKEGHHNNKGTPSKPQPDKDKGTGKGKPKRAPSPSSSSSSSSSGSGSSSGSDSSSSSSSSSSSKARAAIAKKKRAPGAGEGGPSPAAAAKKSPEKGAAKQAGGGQGLGLGKEADKDKDRDKDKDKNGWDTEPAVAIQDDGTPELTL